MPIPFPSLFALCLVDDRSTRLQKDPLSRTISSVRRQTERGELKPAMGNRNSKDMNIRHSDDSRITSDHIMVRNMFG